MNLPYKVYKGLEILPTFPESQWPPIRPTGWIAQGPNGGFKAKARTQRELKAKIDKLKKGK